VCASALPHGVLTIHPDLAEFALQTRCYAEYAIWLLIRYLSPRDQGVEAQDIARLAALLGWRRKSTIYNVLKRGEGEWWTHGSDGKYRRSSRGIDAIFMRYGLPVTRKPKRVPLACFHNPRAAFRNCIHSSEEWEQQSRATIAKRTSLSRHAQLRLEGASPVRKQSSHADLDHHKPTSAECEVMGGIYTDPITGRCNKRLPNRYRSPYPEGPYGRISRASRRRRNSRRYRGRGQVAARREPQKRYFDDPKAAMRAKQPAGLKPREAAGPIYVRDGRRAICLRLPIVAPPAEEHVGDAEEWSILCQQLIEIGEFLFCDAP